MAWGLSGLGVKRNAEVAEITQRARSALLDDTAVSEADIFRA
jgi:hypothetical protein